MAESREQRAENCSGGGFECQEAVNDFCRELHNRERKSGNLQPARHGQLCCYCNYKKVFKVDVQVAMAILARDYKGFGSGLIPSNGGTQYYNQDRVYSSDSVSVAISTSFLPWYLVKARNYGAEKV